ncbi:MAG TPA: hypothetical protein VG147_09385 [Solirubrobacteraceae bacterium]|nr:hypothetical protein [Solirubrobacteraceae bacterium]
MDKNTTDAMGKPGFVESSPSGENVSYYSVVPFPGIANSSEFPSYLSTRVGTHWSTQGLLPPTEPDAVSEVLGLIENGNQTVVYVSEEEGGLLKGAVKGPGDVFGNLYLRDNLTEEYRLLAGGVSEVRFAGATPDGSYVLFSAVLGVKQELGGVTDPHFVPYLFEWDRETGQVSLVGVAGGGPPQKGAVAGPNESEEKIEGSAYAYDQNAISSDGSRIFFSEVAEGRKVYLREPGAIPPKTIEVSQGQARWLAATPDGSEAFYVEGGQLYRFNVDKFEESKKPEPEALAEAREGLTGASAGVLGLVGISQDGSYAYFVANGEKLASNENGEGQNATAGEDNLYEWHEGEPRPIRFIAILNSHSDETNWEGFTHDRAGAADEGSKASRVSADGTIVLITSTNKLTEYENAAWGEIYLYDAGEPLSSTNPSCVSCNPSGIPAKAGAYLSNNPVNSAPASHFSFLTRNLAANGGRIFFQTAESLLPQRATDGQENVYEWEREGVGSCGVGEGDDNGGCLYLISTGQSSDPSYFGDASESGGNVFFFTRQSLVVQDRDYNVDVYDAREDGGLASQNTIPESTCEGEGCLGAPSQASVFGAPGSVTLSGAGNLPPVQTPERKKTETETRAQKLEKALRACRSKPAGRRAHCKAQAQKRYGNRAKKSSRRGK